MDWQKGGSSDNVEVDSGRGGGGMRFGGGRGMGIGGIIIMAILGWVFFKNPMALLDQGGGQVGAPAPSGQPVQVDPQQKQFVSAILHSTEQTWGELFAAAGRTYVEPKLHLFSGSVDTACGAASTAVGPFYCPGDQKVYLDLDFFQELQTRFHAAGDFARAYVIGHEVGHHVQKLLGVFDKVEQARRQGAEMEGANGLSVRQELQADCFAGVWANHSQQRLQWLQDGDVESALNAASQIGDDTLQREARGTVVPDSFTHGTSAQRVKWFKTGFQGGDVNQCNTFAGTP
ncbi:metallopeptidase [Frateuria sp. Soil773]|uniref:KPN_02809 family neutral zinc metallopeptidase n=1 Tax=Frateuria sp. Soil773 TaxID=1736407 RepID=UPI0006F8F88F|nr:neutral zinc metallopeptidase [Frateuria sp. Soil773]KRE88358.1 metallopeptidase [Frateuria sp. Soil773]